MSTSFRERFAALDPRPELEQLRDRVSRVEQSGGGGGGTPEKWQQTAHYGPAEPAGDYHNSPAGLVVDPHDPIQLEEATIDAESAGALTVNVFPMRSDGGQGYPRAPIRSFEFDVSAGVQTLAFDDLELYPLPDAYLGYVFSINQSSIRLRRSPDADIPTDIGPATLRGASAGSGSEYDSHYHFFNLKLSSGRTESAVYTDQGRTVAEFDQINGNHQLTKSADWGAELQRVVDRARPGEVIEIPPGQHITDTPVLVDKPLSILGTGCNGDLRDPAGPQIIPTGEFPVIETTDGVGLRASGFHLRGEGVETGPGIVTHGRSYIDTITADRWNDHVVHLSQDSHDDNLNDSRVAHIAGRSVDGGVVALTKTTSAKRELNALRVDVRMSFGCDHGIFADDGFGNVYTVQQAEGRTKSALHMNTQRSTGWVEYAEGGTSPVIDMQDAQNVGITNHVGGSTSYDEIFNIDGAHPDMPDAHPNNLRLNLTRQSDPFGGREHGNIDFQGNVEVEDGTVIVEVDGRRLKLVRDADGGPAFEEL